MEELTLDEKFDQEVLNLMQLSIGKPYLENTQFTTEEQFYLSIAQKLERFQVDPTDRLKLRVIVLDHLQKIMFPQADNTY